MDERPNGRPGMPRLVEGERLVRHGPQRPSHRSGAAQRGGPAKTGDVPPLAAALAAALSVAAE